MEKYTIRVFLFVVLCTIIVNGQTKTRQCKGFRALDPSEVTVSGCQTGVCKLKRKTSTEIILKIKPDRNIKQLTTSVQAVINNLPFPFIGVDGTSACNNMYDEQGKKVSCPLMANKTYLYKNSFPVLEIYPRIQVLVHWALREGNRDVTCFEIPARIV